MRFGAAAAVAVECAAAASLAGPSSVAASFFLKKEDSCFCCISFAVRPKVCERDARACVGGGKKTRDITAVAGVAVMLALTDGRLAAP